jgi:formate dehydrogenase iron-sulfur subunit
MTRVFVPRDSSALSLGAETVARRIVEEARRRGAGVEIVRNGSRGLFWLEPMVEVETAGNRHAYGPVSPADVESLFEANFLSAAKHRLSLGRPEEIPYLARQTRLTFARAGLTDPVSLDDYIAHGGYRGLRRALEMSPAQIVEQVTRSGLRGRGGAGFPTGIKWKTALEAPATPKYVVCNADEGDSGNFADRMVMEDDPFELIEGMTIAAVCIGAEQGYIYLRSEYPHSLRMLNLALGEATRRGYLGSDVLGSGRRFNIEVRLGAGAYICGEETAMLESLEGKRGMVRFKPPLPAIEGLFGKPTIINNVISLATVPLIIERGGDFYHEYGVGRSRGTIPMQLAGNVARPGLVEVPFGVTLRELVYDYGGGTASGRPVRAVQVGGPLGAYFPESLLDTPIDYEAIADKRGILGHAGVVVFDDSVDLSHMARWAMQFCAIESCGKCTPCRIGSIRGAEIIDRIVKNSDRQANLALLGDLCDTMTNASLCALGGLTPLPVLSALRHFPGDFGLTSEDIARAKLPG